VLSKDLTDWLTHSLTHPPTHSTSWDANSHSASLKISCLLQNLKVHYHVYKSLPLIPVLSQTNPIPVSHPVFLRYFLILSFHMCIGLPSGLFPSSSLTNSVCVCVCVCVCVWYFLSIPSYPPCFDHPNIWWSIQVMKLLFILRSRYYPQLPVLKPPQFVFFH